MNIGIDFDNTIISYNKLFYEIALSKNLIDKEIPKTKVAVRNFLRDLNKDYIFTELQAQIYGPLIEKAAIFEGVKEALNLLSRKHTIFIISHKTKYPYSGEKYKLRSFADKWLNLQGLNPSNINSPISNVFYENTIENKIKRIKDLKCSLFIDDLPNILELLPKEIYGILFNPEDNFCSHKKKFTFKHWSELVLLINDL